MKKIALISLQTPTATNYNGASALPYHLIMWRPKTIEIEVWSFNWNGCDASRISETERSLNIKIHIVNIPKWFKLLSFVLIRLLLPQPMLGYLKIPAKISAEIKDYLSAPESALWIYGEELAHLAVDFKDKPTVITTPDCEAMYYYRVLGMKDVPLKWSSLVRYSLMYHRHATMASKYPIGFNIIYHLVGNADAKFLKMLNEAANVVALRHPHYGVASLLHTESSVYEKIKLLVAGRYDFAMSSAVDVAVNAMINLSEETKKKYLITFLGKGWSESCNKLKNAGFDVEIKGYVDDYAAEVSSHHIQLTPVAVGTGTKGKVLDAFANGLMVIGTPFALENIAVESGKECIEYCSGSDLSKWLTTIAKSPDLIHRIATAGQQAVLGQHGQAKIADEFFELFQSMSSEMTV